MKCLEKGTFEKLSKAKNKRRRRVQGYLGGLDILHEGSRTKIHTAWLKVESSNVLGASAEPTKFGLHRKLLLEMTINYC